MVCNISFVWMLLKKLSLKRENVNLYHKTSSLYLYLIQTGLVKCKFRSCARFDKNEAHILYMDNRKTIRYKNYDAANCHWDRSRIIIIKLSPKDWNYLVTVLTTPIWRNTFSNRNLKIFHCVPKTPNVVCHHAWVGMLSTCFQMQLSFPR